ncbi:MAG: hypothetical protein PVI01_17705 [Gemmatimonadales bacterium]
MACGGKGGTPEPAADGTTTVGRVRIAGNTPLERVLIEPAESGAAGLEVVGDLRPELKRLSGAEVRVSGELVSADRLRVTGYTILDISGHVPIVGLLEVEGGSAAVIDEGGDRTALRDPPAQLLEQNGAKVWVALNTDGVVIGYGIIRER